MADLRILLVDDHPIVIRGLRTLLESQPGWEVCGCASDGLEAVDKAGELNPDVVVMDLTMPNLNGLEAARRILQNTTQAQILVLTVHESEEMVRETLEAGASGYLLKSDPGDELLAAVQSLGQHKPFLSRRITERVSQEPKLPEKQPTRSPLTSRERQIVQLLAEGKSVKSVASNLAITTKTAETHRANIMRKLGLHSATELARYAIRNGIVQP